MGVGAGVSAVNGVGEASWFGAKAATTWIVTWSLLEAALSALIVTVFVQVPSAVARNTRWMAPPEPEATTPIGCVNPAGVKHPPVTLSTIVTFVAAAVPLLP
jgi:hypothetical protein